jgi:uncharacterized protein (TIGR00251 family)
MEFIKKSSESCYLLYLNIKPNSKKLRIMENGGYLTINLLSKPVKNKANKELISVLKEKLNIASTQIKILSGLKSTNKVIQIEFFKKTDENEIIEKLTK